MKRQGWWQEESERRENLRWGDREREGDIWRCQILCSMWDLQLRRVGSSSLTRIMWDPTALGAGLRPGRSMCRFLSSRQE